MRRKVGMWRRFGGAILVHERLGGRAEDRSEGMTGFRLPRSHQHPWRGKGLVISRPIVNADTVRAVLSILEPFRGSRVPQTTWFRSGSGRRKSLGIGEVLGISPTIFGGRAISYHVQERTLLPRSCCCALSPFRGRISPTIPPPEQPKREDRKHGPYDPAYYGTPFAYCIGRGGGGVIRGRRAGA
jgi:hypothetical protein